jgi:hypothetical protein
MTTTSLADTHTQLNRTRDMFAARVCELSRLIQSGVTSFLLELVARVRPLGASVDRVASVACAGGSVAPVLGAAGAWALSTFLGGVHFRCRTCHGLTYNARQNGHRERAFNEWALGLRK